MGLETGTFTDDLIVTNPPGSDSKSQGDDHLRLIKSCLRNTFKRATKAFSLPGVVSKNANYTVLATDENLTIECDTTSAFTLTLPATAGINAGWAIYVVKKTTDSNPVFLVPAAGTINGFTKVRRSKEFHITKVLWTGSVWAASRPHGLEIGTSHPYHGATLPNGYIWADGSAFNAANYVELNGVLGGATAPDLRGRAPFGRDNMGGATAGRITNAGSGIVGTTLGTAGGGETHTLTTAEMPNHNHDYTDPGHTHTVNDPGHGHGVTVTDPQHSHGVSGGTQGGTTSGSVQAGASSAPVTNAAISINNASTGITASANSNTSGITNASAGVGITITGRGSGNAHAIMPPTLIANYIVVAE